MYIKQQVQWHLWVGHVDSKCVEKSMLFTCWVVGARDAVVDAFTEKDDKKADAEQDEAAIAEARREAEERRKEKHRKMEEEREKMRQDIRDKVFFEVAIYCVVHLWKWNVLCWRVVGCAYW